MPNLQNHIVTPIVEVATYKPPGAGGGDKRKIQQQ